MNANNPKHVPAFTLINLDDGEPYPWALMCADNKEWPLAHFATKAEGIACLNECIRVAALEVDDDADFPS